MIKNISVVTTTMLVLTSANLLAVQPGDLLLASSSSGYLGVLIQDITPEDVSELNLPAERGVRIENVEPESPAAAAGIEKGDVLMEFAGMPVLSVKQFRRLVADTPPGRTVSISAFRDGERLQLSAKISSRDGEGVWSMRIPGHPKVEVLPDLHFEVEPGNRFFSFRTPRPRLGIEAVRLTDQMADFLGVPSGSGVLVMRVAEGTPAQQAGIQAGDVITAIDGESVESPSDVRRLLDSGEHQLTLIRDRLEETVTVDIADSQTKGREGTRL
jgi:serine protease Do